MITGLIYWRSAFSIVLGSRFGGRCSELLRSLAIYYCFPGIRSSCGSNFCRLLHYFSRVRRHSRDEMAQETRLFVRNLPLRLSVRAGVVGGRSEFSGTHLSRRRHWLSSLRCCSPRSLGTRLRNLCLCLKTVCPIVYSQLESSAASRPEQPHRASLLSLRRLWGKPRRYRANSPYDLPEGDLPGLARSHLVKSTDAP